MNDTSSAVTDRMRSLVRAKSPAWRIRAGCGMYDFSKKLITDAIRLKNPGISRRELRCELLLKFYGDYFSPETKKKIVSHLRSL